MGAFYKIAMAAATVMLIFGRACAEGDSEHPPPAPLVNGGSQSLASAVGIYHWGGHHARGIASGLRAITGIGSSIARITVSPRMAIDYNTGTSCVPGFRLASVFDDLELRAAIADPQLKVLILTAYDGTSFGDCRTHSYLNPAFYSPSMTAAIVEEYRELTSRLLHLFRGSGKTFILSNWEGDNALYCGQAFVYTTSIESKEACDKTYGVEYAGNRDVNDSIEGMKLWLKARYDGVSSGRQTAGLQVLSDAQVFVAPEISAVHMLHRLGLPSMLHDVLPYVQYDFISYSAYESLGSPDPISAIKSDIASIKVITGSTNIILGEIGCARSTCPYDLAEFTLGVTSAALESGVRYVIQWNLYDQTTLSDFGLFGMDGAMTELGHFYRRLYGGALSHRATPALPPNQPWGG